MDEFNFDETLFLEKKNYSNETEMSTPIHKLRKKKTEIDDEANSYSNIRMKLYNELNPPSILQNKDTNLQNKDTNLQYNDTLLYEDIDLYNQPIKLKKTIKLKKPIKIIKSNKNYYINILVISLIFIFVNNSYLNDHLILKINSYYTIVIIKLIAFLTLYYIYKNYII